NAQISDVAGGTYNFINDGLLEMVAGGNVSITVPLNNSGTVLSTNGNLYLSGPVTNSGTLLADGGFIEVQGGTLGGTIDTISGNVGLVGTYTVPAATIDMVTFDNTYLGWGGDGAAVFAGSGTLASNGFVYVNQYNYAATQLQLIDGITWENAGTVRQYGGLVFGGSASDTATIVNQAGATYELWGGNAQISDVAGGTYNFINAGLLEMVAGGNVSITVPLNNSGTVLSTNGALYLSGPVTNSGTLVADGGFIEVQGGTLGGTIEALSDSVGLIGTYAVAADTTDTVTFGGANLGWYGDGYAVFAGPGTLASNGNVAISQYNYSSVQLQLIDGITWANAGTVNQYGGLVFGGSTIDTATILNQAGATYVLNGGNAEISDTAGGTYNFINAGTLKMVNGGGDTIAVPLTNTGLVTSTNGNLVVAGGFVNSGTMLANGGNLYLEGGTLGGTIGVGPNGGNAYLTGTFAVAGGATDTVALAGATFGDGGGASIAYFSGTGTVATDGSATVNNYYYNNPELILENGVTWDNFGAIYQIGGLQFGNSPGDSATLVNEAGATYSLSGGSADFEIGGTAGTYSFVNEGLLQQINGGGDSIAVPLDNTGVISSNNGVLYIDGPLTNSGTIQTAGGSVQINGGTLGGTLNAANGAIYLMGTYAVDSGATDTVTLASVTIGDGGGSAIAYLSGSGTLATDGSATINNYYYSSPELVLENGVTWDNFGAIYQIGGLQFGNGAGDSATFVNEAGATYTLSGGSADFELGGTAGTYSFVNNGLLQQINGGGDHIAVPLDNTGLISSDNGEIYIDGALTNTGTIVTAGGSVQIDGDGSLGGTLDAANGAIWVMGTYTAAYGVTDTATLNSVTFGNGGGSGIAYLSGLGTLDTSGSASVTNYYYSDPDLVLMGGITWDDSGSLYVNAGLQFGNQSGDSATLDMEAGSVLNLDNGSSALEAPDSGTYNLVESGLLEMTGGGTNSIAVAVDETSTGTVTASNGTLDFDDGATIAGAVNGSQTINFSGNVTLAATGDVTANTVSFNSGTLFMQGGTINSPHLTLGSGEYVVGYGALGDAGISPIIVDASGGLLTVNGPVSGSPEYEIETGATLALNGSNSGPVTFNGTDATLELNPESGFSGQIDNFAGGDTIDLPGITLSAVSYVGSDLIGTLAAGGTISLSAPGVDSGLQLELGTDSSGASTIYLEPSPVSAVPDLLTALGPNDSLVLPDAHVYVHIVADPTLEIENAATTPADGLNVDISTITGSAFAHGQIDSLAPQAIDDSSIGVGLNDLTAGAESGTVGLDYQTDGTVSGIEADLGTQTLNLSGNVYRLADPSISAPTNVYLHTGDNGGSVTEGLTIANADPADGYSEGLEAAAINGSGGDQFTTTGATGDIAAGSSDDTSIGVEIPTETAGYEFGYADLALTSDGAGVDTLGLTSLDGGSTWSAVNDFSLASNANGVWSYLSDGALLTGTTSGSTYQSWNNGGSQPNAAFVTLNPTSTTQAYSGTVVLPPTYLDLDPQGTGNVSVEFTAPSDGAYTFSGSVLGVDTNEHAHEVAIAVDGSVVASATLSAYQQVIPLDLTETLTAGDTVDFISYSGPGDQPDNLGTGLSLTVTDGYGDDVPVSATIDNYATAAIEQGSGAGSLSAIGNTYTLDFGTVAAAPGEIPDSLDIANIATGQADWLSGSLTASGDAAFSDTGLGSIGTVSAGDSTPLSIDLSTANAGTFSQTITLAADSTNPDGPSPLTGETIVVVGTVLSTAVLAAATINEPSPIVLPDVHVASLVANDQIALDISNTGSDVLSGFVSSATGSAYGSGTITDLPIGQSDTTDIIAGLNNTQAGSLSGTVNLSFTSGTNDVPLSPQSVSLESNVYRYADPSIIGPVNAIVHVGDGVSDTDSEALVISNTAPADGYSENLDATAQSVVSGNLTGASGTASEIAAGATNTASATFSFSTATAGTVSGEVAVSEISDGSTIDTLGTTLLGTVDVPVSVTVNNYATAALQQTAGPGELVQTGSVYTLNLGDVAQGTGSDLVGLDIANTATGPADWLTGSLSSSGSPAIMAYNGSAADALSVTYFEVSDTGNGPDFGSGGTPNVANGSTLGPDGLPVASAPAGISDVDPSTGEITWWDPSLNSGVVETGTGIDSLPYSSNMYVPNSTGSNDATYYETAILQGTFSLS
ncbi:MAG: choice-of-anchor D domain-containing protein, partial [Acetobacteraceae bacterium]